MAGSKVSFTAVSMWDARGGLTLRVVNLGMPWDLLLRYHSAKSSRRHLLGRYTWLEAPLTKRSIKAVQKCHSSDMSVRYSYINLF